MISDQAKDRPGAGEAKDFSANSSAIHLEIDGTMKLSHYPMPRKQDSDISIVGNTVVAPAGNTAEAGLRHIIRLQHQALSQQSIRIQQQRTLIFRLNMLVNKLKQQSFVLNEKRPSARFRWLDALLRPHNQTQGSASPSD